MWSRTRALERLAVDLGVSRRVRKRPGAREAIYEQSTPGYARAWIENIARPLSPELRAYVRACIVFESKSSGINLRQRTFQRDARGVEFSRLLLHALALVEETSRIVRRPAMVQYARRIAAAPKQILPPDEAIDRQIDEAVATVKLGMLPNTSSVVVRPLAGFRRGTVSAEELEELGSRIRNKRSIQRGWAGVGFGIAHELAHHLLGHGEKAHWPGDDHPPGKAILSQWRASIGYEPDRRWSRPHRREFDADAFALYLLSGGGRRDGGAGILTAGMASFCLLGLSVLEDETARTLDVPARSHPSFRQRMKSMLEHNFLAFDEVSEPIGQYVDPGRHVPQHPSSYLLQNIYVTQVVGALIDDVALRPGGEAFGVRSW